MPSGVLDANVIIGFAKGGLFPLLRSLYAPLFVPDAVVAEVTQPSTQLAGASELSLALHHWITPVAFVPLPASLAATSLSPADQQTIAVALEESVDYLLTGDERLRRVAANHGIACLGTTEVAVVLKLSGLIGEVKPALDQMRNQGFGIDDATYRQALTAAGE